MILIVGDSFAENCNQSSESWTFLLSEHIDLINLAQAGCGEYKILKQLQSIDLNKFDKIIISHTSFTRFHVEHNPFYSSGKYSNCDLIYEDVLHKPDSKIKEHLLFLFEKLVDIEYQQFVYDSICKEIKKILKNKVCLHLNFFDQNSILQRHFDNILELRDVWEKYPGHINHMNQQGNIMVYEKIFKLI